MADVLSTDDDNAREEIKAAIEFYEARGANWLMVVSYLSAKALGHWPLPKGCFMYWRKAR